MRRGDDEKWVTLSGMGWLTPFVVVSPILLTLAVTNGVHITAILARRFALPWVIVLSLGAGAVAFGLVVLVLRLLVPPVRVNPGAGLLRAGRRTFSYEDVTAAQLVVGTSKTRRNLNLVLRSSRGRRAAILVRDGKGRTLTAEESRLVVDLIGRSNIAMPTSPDDPTGAFARYNFPGNVTKADALALVEHPPTFSDPLPIPPVV
ncbi:hypothetical protein [Subtercola boreus]|uniref:Uncharacterized protein n=1 Tax=Subtercola boreus TaxID=120213 RepID=A0A3E0WAM5_9MICO|nr:hypothetical protein [Subtercola boreus]RFA19268.1 hypothetical protein B7R24_11450 [Subtercola boreus]RFA19528.1 hypothetical protein B7R23_11430 [Subtercola boreus]RFA25894.1 hypothetical protein B7R25_11550 [Subtercola boreus]